MSYFGFFYICTDEVAIFMKGNSNYNEEVNRQRRHQIAEK